MRARCSLLLTACLTKGMSSPKRPASASLKCLEALPRKMATMVEAPFSSGRLTGIFDVGEISRSSSYTSELSASSPISRRHDRAAPDSAPPSPMPGCRHPTAEGRASCQRELLEAWSSQTFFGSNSLLLLVSAHPKKPQVSCFLGAGRSGLKSPARCRVKSFLISALLLSVQ